MRNISLALNICTYNRRNYIEKNIHKLLSSDFFVNKNSVYYGKMQIFVIDNGSELPMSDNVGVHIFHNKNTGGSGGFQRGIEEIRKYPCEFSHVIFMDDDVEFEPETFYILFDFLASVDEQYIENPVAGRMMCLDKPNIQYTAAEVWNGGNIEHIEFMRNIADGTYKPRKAVYNSGAEYGGWWFCCFPMAFVSKNDVLPFFIHCDDVEYGLRCGKSPIIIEGVQVWHETYDKRMTPLMNYYDTRNTLFVNELHNRGGEPKKVLSDWKDKITKLHVKGDFLSEYYVIRGLWDYMNGIEWLKKLDAEHLHRRLGKAKKSKLRNAVFWRMAEWRFRNKYF